MWIIYVCQAVRIILFANGGAAAAPPPTPRFSRPSMRATLAPEKQASGRRRVDHLCLHCKNAKQIILFSNGPEAGTSAQGHLHGLWCKGALLSAKLLHEAPIASEQGRRQLGTGSAEARARRSKGCEFARRVTAAMQSAKPVSRIRGRRAPSTMSRHVGRARACGPAFGLEQSRASFTSYGGTSPRSAASLFQNASSCMRRTRPRRVAGLCTGHGWREAQR